ncbi:hypothetical protein F5I97DRAFT_1887327, partial [Phlebopus sp. FC_14]
MFFYCGVVVGSRVLLMNAYLSGPSFCIHLHPPLTLRSLNPTQELVRLPPCVAAVILQALARWVVVKMDSKSEYVRLPGGARKVYQGYGTHSIKGWHKKHKKYV